jgi:para-aminobenzoate synthetase component 1
MRNDLSRVCTDDSVRVDQLCKIEPYAFVQHLVSVVSGRLRNDASLLDLLLASFPGGSITGAPKVEAMRKIAELERVARGFYCGSMGYFGCGGMADFNIMIRTITYAHGHLQIPVGGGITAASDPEAEERETWQKAEGLLRALPI